tara:strand:- start:18664 stop:21069 length:2406 start_codon:yes stop_codon:yes gene_type:complete
MTTNFALSLSFDGIQLLQRADDGWLLVGKTALDVPDLGAALVVLRENAMRLSPDGMRTKLLIANEQIKYVTLETAQTSLADVQAALDGATPYAIADLVIDFDRNGGRTFIAAVARETLDEAEAFAKKYDFEPVCFAAIAEPMTFQSEVFFGPVKGVAGKVDRDASPVVVTGIATIPAPEVVAPDDLEDEPSEGVPMFESRARMAAPESVPPQHVTSPPVLAVPTGAAKGPSVAKPETNTPSAPSKPVALAPKTSETAPAITGDVGTLRPEDIAASGGFATRRKAPIVATKPQDAAKPEAAKLTRKQKKTAFATKQAQSKAGKPRFLGLILTAILLVAMALVAIWASTLSEEGLANWFGVSDGGIVEVAQQPVDETGQSQAIAIAPQSNNAMRASVATQVAEVPVLPRVRTSAVGRVLSPSEADRIYAATGVWQRAPRLQLEPRSDALSAQVPQIAPVLAALPLTALPDFDRMTADLPLIAPGIPPAPGVDFPRDADGFILATLEGTLTPRGAMVYAGSPSIRPPLRPRVAVDAQTAVFPSDPEAPQDVVLISGPPAIIPPVRPGDAAVPEEPPVDDTLATTTPEQLEGFRPALRPLGLAPTPQELALATARPKVRPDGLVPPPEPAAPPQSNIADIVAAIAEAAPAGAFVTPTALAIRASPRPDPRPRNFARVVKRATDMAARQTAQQQAPQQAAQQAPQQAAAQPAAAMSNAPVRSSGSVPRGVARAATLSDAMNLHDVSLVGVYGRPNQRRALVRLGNGRFVKVQVGSSLDSGRVTAIGDSVLNYVKRGKTIALQLPSS